MEVKYRRKSKLNITQKVKLVTDYNAGYPVRDLLKKYGVSRQVFYKYLKQQIN